MKRISLVVLITALANTILTAKTFYASDDTLEITTLNYNHSTVDSTILINIDYPLITGTASNSVISKVNIFLEEEFNQSITWFEELASDTSLFEDYLSEMQFIFETGFQVEYNSKDFVSILMNHYQFTGGAHGNFFAMGYNINMRNGIVLTLKDIITEESFDLLGYECEQAILETFEANTLLQAGLFEDEITISDDQDFYIIPGALVIQFDPYEIGPYAMGEITAEISFEKITDILKDNLPFTKK